MSLQYTPDQLEARIASQLRPEVSPEKIFWLRLDVGQHYLFHHLCIPHSDADVLSKDPAFWAWWRSVWHINDLTLLAHIERNELSILEYELLMRPRQYRYKPNRVVMASANTPRLEPVLDEDCPI